MKKTLTILVPTFVFAALMLTPTDVVRAQGVPQTKQFWWPDQLDLSPLRQHGAESNPMGADFDYAAAFPLPDDFLRLLDVGTKDWPITDYEMEAGEILAGWKGITNPDGTDVECTPATKEQLLKVATVADVLRSISANTGNILFYGTLGAHPTGYTVASGNGFVFPPGFLLISLS